MRGGAVAGLAVLMPSLAACATNTSDSPGGSSNAAKARTVTVAFQDTPSSLDIEQDVSGLLGMQVGQNCYGEAIRLEQVKADNGEWVDNWQTPGFADGIDKALCESFEVSDDYREYTFHLRPDIKSAYGNPITTEDVIWTNQRRFHYMASSYSFMMQAGMSGPDDIHKIDDHTYKVVLKQPNVQFLKTVAMTPAGGLIDSVEAKKHATADDPWAAKWLGQHTAGYGAFMVDSYKNGQGLTMVPNPNFYGDKPQIDKVNWRVVPQAADQLSMLIRGDIDIATSLDANQRARLKGVDGVSITSFPANIMMRLFPQQKQVKEFADARVRQALQYAMPVDELNNSVYGGGAATIKSVLPSMSAGYTDEYYSYSYDPGKAKQLLAAAGVSGLSFKMMYSAAVAEAQAIGSILKTAFADVGVTVTLQPLRDAQFWDAYNRSQYECALLQGSAFSLDPAFVGTLWLADKTATIGWTNKEYSQTLAKVSSIAETKARLEWIRKMQQIFMADLPVIGVISPGFHVAHRSDVDGFIWSATNTIRYQRMVRG